MIDNLVMISSRKMFARDSRIYERSDMSGRIQIDRQKTNTDCQKSVGVVANKKCHISDLHCVCIAYSQKIVEYVLENKA